MVEEPWQMGPINRNVHLALSPSRLVYSIPSRPSARSLLWLFPSINPTCLHRQPRRRSRLPSAGPSLLARGSARARPQRCSRHPHCVPPPSLRMVPFIFMLWGHEHKVLHLVKALYGFQQAPRAWYAKLDESLIQLGFQRSTSEHVVYLWVCWWPPGCCGGVRGWSGDHQREQQWQWHVHGGYAGDVQDEWLGVSSLLPQPGGDIDRGRDHYVSKRLGSQDSGERGLDGMQSKQHPNGASTEAQ